MFARIKKTGGYGYLQLVENHREGNKVKQTVIATLGRSDQLNESGKLNSLLRSLTKQSVHAMLIEARDKAQKSVSKQGGLALPFCFNGCGKKQAALPSSSISSRNASSRFRSRESSSLRLCIASFPPGQIGHAFCAGCQATTSTISTNSTCISGIGLWLGSARYSVLPRSR